MTNYLVVICGKRMSKLDTFFVIDIIIRILVAIGILYNLYKFHSSKYGFQERVLNGIEAIFLLILVFR